MKLRGMRGQREAADVAGAAVSGVAARGAEVLCGILARVSAGHYAVLEVPRGASQKDVRNAYLRLSLLAHPDKNPGMSACTSVLCPRLTRSESMLMLCRRC